MGIVGTDQWFSQDIENEQRISEICFTKLHKHLPFLKKEEIYTLLMRKGLCDSKDFPRELNALRERNTWKICALFYKRLLKEWEGPDIPVVILPGGQLHRLSEDKLNGVAFMNLIVLIIHPAFPTKKLQALITHEYHHVCRLNRVPFEKEESSIFKTIIIEGLAEYAVWEYVGEAYTGSWVHLYLEYETWGLFRKYIKGNEETRKDHANHDVLLFGGDGVPPMIGYYLGYQIIKSFAHKHQITTKKMIDLPYSTFEEYVKNNLNG